MKLISSLCITMVFIISTSTATNALYACVDTKSKQLSSDECDGTMTEEELIQEEGIERLKEAAYRELRYKKIPIPRDPRPEPRSVEDLERYQRMPDPFERSPKSLTLQVVDKYPDNVNVGSFKSFTWGDIILGKNYTLGDAWYPYGYWRHAAIFHKQKGEFYSAWPGVGVRIEEKDWWSKDWNTAAGLNVHRPCVAIRKKAAIYAASQIGKPYKITYNKDDEKFWYCSKLPYVAYRKNSRIDISNNSLMFITPSDLYDSKETRLFYAKNNDYKYLPPFLNPGPITLGKEDR